MHDDDVLGKRSLEGEDDLARQGDFRHEHDDSAPFPAHGRRRLDIDLRLAASRHSLQKKAAILTPPDIGKHGIDSRPLLRRQVDHRPDARHIAVAVAQNAPLLTLHIACFEHRTKDSGGKSCLAQSGIRPFPLCGKKFQQTLLCTPPPIAREQRLIERMRERQDIFITCLVALLRQIELSHIFLLHEFFQETRNLGGKRRKHLAKCRKPHDAIFTERTENLLRRSRQRRLFPLFCLILDLDLQAALARHEETHRLSG